MKKKVRYPWSRWFDGNRRTMTLRRHRDFKCEAYVMAQQIRNKAFEVGSVVSISIEGSVLRVRINGE